MDLIEQRARDVVERATRRAAILHASEAWGSSEDGALIDRLLDLIEQLLAERAEYVSIDRMGLRNALTEKNDG